MADSAPKDIPQIPPGIDQALQFPLNRMREEMRRLLGFIGDAQYKAVTASNAASLVGGGTTIVNAGGGSGGGTTPDLTPPPTLSGLFVTAGITHYIVTTDAPTYTQGHGPGSTRIYAAKKDPDDPVLATFSDATLDYEGYGPLTIFAVPCEPNKRVHVWAKWVTADGIESTDPAGGINGFYVTTGHDVRDLLNALTEATFNPNNPYTKVGFRADQFYIAPKADFYQEAAPSSPTSGQLWFQPSTGVTKTWNGSAWGTFSVPLPFVVNTQSIVEDGVTIPPGVYMDAAYIRNLTAMIARLGTAVIDDAKIASLSAAKLTVGDGTVGGDLRSTNYVAGVSGWIIRPSGAAQFPAQYILGLVQASQINANGLSIRDTSGNLLLGSGTPLRADYVRNNLVDSTWWHAGASIPWNQNVGSGDTDLNRIIWAIGPKGSPDAVWEGVAGTLNNESGGWNAGPGGSSNWFPVDTAKTYRFAVPIQKVDGDGSLWWGISGNDVDDLNTTAQNINPYFCGGFNSWVAGRWYLFVGYVFPQGATGLDNSGAGVYDMATGQLVAAGSNYNWHAGVVNTGTRAYQYYSTVNGSRARFGRPMVHIVDGTEPSLRELLQDSAIRNPPSYRILVIGNGASGYPSGSLGVTDLRTGATPAGVARSYVLVKFSRTTGAYVSSTGYDVYGVAGDAISLATALNALTSADIFALYSHDEPCQNRLTGGLPAAIYRCGGSPGKFASPQFQSRGCYVLIGYGNCGQGNAAYEAYTGILPFGADGPDDAWQDVAFSIINGSIVMGGPGMAGFQIDANNVSTYMANAAIGAAQIGSLNVGLMSTAMNGGASSGARVDIASNLIRVYDSSNVLRVRLGVW